MNKSILILALFGALGLSACNKQPDVINVPAPPAATPVPGPAGAAGPQGATGSEGSTGSTGAAGSTGETGKSGDGTTVIVMPPASAPSSAPAN
ncbi:hypothetical protein [Rhodoferax ferrireducens]|uniref:hypothetical protein n=1 Tax=Rhodoferax ferrireducens TaxID=192843 RepID=UPI000E0D273F|nr:hypothetical protein [Rhodoferax ferrireducens]